MGSFLGMWTIKVNCARRKVWCEWQFLTVLIGADLEDFDMVYFLFSVLLSIY